MNPLLAQLQPYPFEKLAELKAGTKPPADRAHIALSIGEPKHTPPQFALDALTRSLPDIAKYPVTKGLDELRIAIANWATKRFGLEAHSLNPDGNVIPVAGTREALFSFTQAVVDASQPNAKVVMPNPFYQIYEGATLLAGAQPVFLNCDADNGYAPDLDRVDDQTWRDCQLLFLCSPGNPTGTVLTQDYLKNAIALADKYDFVIASDECYSELYFDEANPPTGLLGVCAAIGRHDFSRCVVFHSLSKRSNLPGLRSGFVAGDATLLKPYLTYRTYEGCALPLPTQMASIAAWQDETHVLHNRDQYRIKFDKVTAILSTVTEVTRPEAGFYLWLKTPMEDDRDFARSLYESQNITVLPGQFLGRDTQNGNPGRGYVRMALVASIDECEEAANRIVTWFTQHKL